MNHTRYEVAFLPYSFTGMNTRVVSTLKRALHVFINRNYNGRAMLYRVKFKDNHVTCKLLVSRLNSDTKVSTIMGDRSNVPPKNRLTDLSRRNRAFVASRLGHSI